MKAPGARRVHLADRVHRRRARLALLLHPHEEGLPGHRDHGARAEPARRHGWLGRGLLRGDARPLPRRGCRELRPHRLGVRVLGRHRDVLRRHGRGQHGPRFLRSRPPHHAPDPPRALPGARRRPRLRDGDRRRRCLRVVRPRDRWRRREQSRPRGLRDPLRAHHRLGMSSSH